MKKQTALIGLGLLAAAAFAAPKQNAKQDAELKEKLKAIAVRLDADRVTYGNWNNGYLRLHCGYKGSGETRVTSAEHAAMQTRYLAALAERDALVPKDLKHLVEYGEALMYKGDFAAAKDVLARAVAQNGKSYEYAQACYRSAECLFALGDRAGCVRELEALKAKGIRTDRRGLPSWSGLASSALIALKGADTVLDLMRLPAFTDAKAYPEPQQAKYEDAFTPLSKIAIVLRGVAKDDARVKLLETRLRRLGAAYAFGGSAPFTLEVALDAAAPVDKREGYALTVDAKGAKVAARDRQGVLWGLVSFMQMIDYGKKQVRRGALLDWPDTEGRGYLGRYWNNCAEYTVFQKMNSVDLQHAPVTWNQWSPLNVFMTEQLANQFRDLGLTLYYGIQCFTMYPHMPLSNPETLAFHTEICKRYAKMGAGVYFPFDDGRYPLCPPDKEKYDIGANCDAAYITKLYQAVKKEYPDFKMIFCPPFYWGPDSKASYPEDRETYLKSLGEKLDPGVDLYWTGPMVKGISKMPYQTEWYTKLTGRKPTIFQNGTGPHNLLGYVIDATDWNGWHYPGFFENGIRAFHKNSHTPDECCQIATLADCLWNVKGYDMNRAAKRGINQLLGEKMYDILAPGLPALAYFDKYKYGQLNADVLHEDAKDLEAKAALAEDCWKKALEYNPAVGQYGAYGRGVGWAKAVAKGAKNPPDFLAKFKKEVEECRAFAEKEVGVDKSKGDLFYSPVDMSGGQAFTFKKGGNTGCEETRFIKCLRGASTTFPQCGLRFECDPFPPAGAYELYLCGLDDELPAPNTIRIKVNGKTVYEGETGFVNAKSYSVKKFTIPFETMVRYNQVTIENTTPGFNTQGTPWLFFNYAVIKKAK